MREPKDVFRLVSLQGPDAERSLDPMRPAAPERMFGHWTPLGVHWRNPNAEMAADARSLRFLDEKDVRETVPWTGLAHRFKSDPTADVGQPVDLNSWTSDSWQGSEGIVLAQCSR